MMSSFRSSCGACRFLRRKCDDECVYAPYFCHEESSTHFSAVHKVFGASNVSKLLLNLPPQDRSEAAATITYEALSRMHDPVYGCVAHVFALQQQVAKLQEEIECLEAQFAGDQSAKYEFEVWNNTNCGFQLASGLEILDVPNSCSQQPSNVSYSTSMTKSLQCPQNEWRDQALSFDATNELSSFENLNVGIDQTTFLCDPVLDYGSMYAM